MSTRSTKQLAAMLSIHPSRVEQWISRGQFRPSIFAEKGLGREWSFDEALRLTLFVRLVDFVGVDPRDAGTLTLLPISLADTPTYFVAYRDRPEFLSGWQGEAVRAEDLGQFLQQCCPRYAVMAAGHSPEVETRDSEKPEMAPAYAAVMIDLSAIAADLSAAWGE